MNELILSIESINELETAIRNQINYGVLHYSLLEEKTKWWMLCSALDVLGGYIDSL